MKKKEGDYKFLEVPSAQSHVSFVNKLEHQEDFNIIDYLYYYNGGGVSIGDINNDGLFDIYFSSNEGSNKLYLNKGSFSFEDITESAGVASLGKWKTGINIVDVNGDNLLDLYVCRVSGYEGLEGHNELYLNNGDLTFTESSVKYGLDFSGFSTQSSFFDMDKDGDLDLYLLNHAVHTQKSHGRADLRLDVDQLSGDRIFENIGGYFEDITSTTGIYSSQIGYGLGIGLSDFNEDGFTDLYISNDFSENDYLYINNGDKTFSERLTDMAHHSSRFSMGNDIADYNNDGRVDIITLDMLPEDEVVRKRSVGEDPYEIFRMKLQFGYMNQYSRNTLMLNRGGKFSDVAMLAGIHATDWSWGPLFADFNNDGWKDIFISNGIARRPNDLDYIDFISGDKVRNNPNLSDAAFVSEMPLGKVKNYFFSNNQDLTFENVTESWSNADAQITNGAAYADLDNDGDLDLVLNNLNEEADILENLSLREGVDHEGSNFLKLRFFGAEGAPVLGTRVTAFVGEQIQMYELFSVRGFQSSTTNEIIMGLGASNEIDSLLIEWPNGSVERQGVIQANQFLKLWMPVQQQPTKKQSKPHLKETIFQNVTASLGIDYKHHENRFVEFNREPLIPHMNSQEGPAICIGDVNGDGQDDFFVGGARGQSAHLYLQLASGFKLARTFEEDKIFEDVDAAFFDVENDGDLDLLVVTGGNEFDKNSPNELSRIYLNDGKGSFEKANDMLPNLYETGSVVAVHDVNNDGFLDIFIGRVAVPWHYGRSPKSHLLLNNAGQKFEVTKIGDAHFLEGGMIKDALWADIDNNGEKDLILAAMWQPIKVCFANEGLLASPVSISEDQGWWQTVKALDYDQDGDLDLLVGNLGLNSKLQATHEAPLRMYLNDFDDNGQQDPILTYDKKGVESIFVSKKDLTKQLPGIKKKFLDHKTFAEAPLRQLFSEDLLNGSEVLVANELRSGIFENNEGQFIFKAFDLKAQVSMIRDMLLVDINDDGRVDALTAGNFFGSSIDEGRYSEDYGTVLLNTSEGWEVASSTAMSLYLEGQVVQIEPIMIAEKRAFIVIRNDAAIQIFNY